MYVCMCMYCVPIYITRAHPRVYCNFVCMRCPKFYPADISFKKKKKKLTPIFGLKSIVSNGVSETG